MNAGDRRKRRNQMKRIDFEKILIISEEIRQWSIVLQTM